MTSGFGQRRASPWLTALFGVALLTVAALDIALLGTIGWTVWRRASLADQWQSIRDEDNLRLAGVAGEASLLRTGIGRAQERIALAREALPSDAELARYVANLRTEAALMGVTINEITPQPMPPSGIPVRRFTIHAQGYWLQLLGFVSEVSQAPLSTARIDNVTISSGATADTLSFDLIVVVRPPEPLAEAPVPSQVSASSPPPRWQE